MTAKQIRLSLINQLGNKEDAMNLYKQIQRSLSEERKPLKTISWIEITRNDYTDPSMDDYDVKDKVIHFETNLGMCETVLTNR